MKQNCTHIFNCFEEAILIERILSSLFPPTSLKNLYSVSKEEPVFSGSRTYFKDVVINDAMARVVFDPFTEVKWKGHIIDQDGYVICRYFEAANYSTQPIYPKHGLKMIRDIIENLLLTSCAWSGVNYLNEDSLLEVIIRSINDYSKVIVLDEAVVEEMASEIATVVVDLTQPIAHILMRDRWIMFFYKLCINTGDIKLEETIDYRIHQWEIQHGVEFRKRHLNIPL